MAALGNTRKRKIEDENDGHDWEYPKSKGGHSLTVQSLLRPDSQSK